MSPTAYPHIEQDENGTQFVAGTRLKVILLIGEHVAWKLDAPQLQLQHPGLTMAGAHAVLSYFYANETAVRAELEQRERDAGSILSKIGTKLSREQLIARFEERTEAGVAR